MQKLDPHTLFSIFEKGDEEIYREHGMEDQLQNPYVLMGMVIRGLENFSLMNIRRKYYTRLYSYLTRIDSNRFDNLYTIGETFEAARVEGGLQHLMFFFESIEEYEKCAIIKKWIEHLIIAKEIKLELDIR